jgi:hypothetical protein
MQSRQAREIADGLYAGASKPLSINHNRPNSQSLEWWLGNPRNESIEQDRKLAALRLYLYLAARAHPRPESGQFPAAFDMKDARLRPDKGVIKACLSAEPALIRSLCEGEELMFELTEEVRQRLSLTT